MSIFSLYNNFSKSESELSMLNSLRKNAQLRLEEAFIAISNFFEDSRDDICRDIKQSDVLRSWEFARDADMEWVRGTQVDTDHPLMVSIKDLEKRIPELLKKSGIFIFEFVVADNFPHVDQLIQDINYVRDHIGTNVKFVVKRDKSVLDFCFKGGVVLELELDKDQFNDIEFNINGVSSNDMAGFVRKVIATYVENNPGISLSRLQYDLRNIHRGDKWEFVEDMEKIQKLVDDGKRVYYSFAEPGVLDDGTKYVVYNQLLRRKHLPLIIEFARHNSIL